MKQCDADDDSDDRVQNFVSIRKANDNVRMTVII